MTWEQLAEVVYNKLGRPPSGLRWKRVSERKKLLYMDAAMTVVELYKTGSIDDTSPPDAGKET